MWLAKHGRLRNRTGKHLLGADPKEEGKKKGRWGGEERI